MQEVGGKREKTERDARVMRGQEKNKGHQVFNDFLVSF